MNKKKPITIIRGNLKSKAIFDHSLEEKKALNYLKNLIQSPILSSRTFEIFRFACDVVGLSKLAPAIFALLMEITEEADIFNELVIKERLSDYIPRNRMTFFMKTCLLPLIDNRLNRLSSSKQCETEKRLTILRDTFKLTNDELEVLTLLYLLNSGVIQEYFSNKNIFDLSEFSTFKNHAHHLLGLSRSNISRVFAERKLFNINLMEKNHITFITDWCKDYLAGLGTRELHHEFFSRGNDVALELSDFTLPKDELAILETLMKSSSGHNILFYGEPGTGKTTLAKCLAKTYGKEIITVRIIASNDLIVRLRAVYATVKAVDNNTSIIIVDEADELLNTDDSLFFRSQANKSWINTLMETHQQKIIWITNRFESIHLSTMRRFSFSMEFKQFNEENRFKVLMHELGREGHKDFFSEEELRGLCKTYSVNAAGIISAINLLDISGNADRKTVISQIKTVLKNHEKVTAGKHQSSRKRKKDFGGYSLAGLNCSENPEKVIGIIRRYMEARDNDSVKSNIPMSMLLYGMPGTGKSEFVYYLGHTFGKEVSLRRSSDIQSMWVGATEKNIADAFQQAQDNDKILFFDEADSFLFPRQNAQRSWEISHTNEILTQLEDYGGIVIFATNDMPGLDHASLRRFRFKVEFRPLMPNGVLALYKTILFPLLPEGRGLSEAEQDQLQGIKNITPGDFAVVRDQLIFSERGEITNSQLIGALNNEVRYKQTGKDMIGFKRYA